MRESQERKLQGHKASKRRRRRKDVTSYTRAWTMNLDCSTSSGIEPSSVSPGKFGKVIGQVTGVGREDMQYK